MAPSRGLTPLLSLAHAPRFEDGSSALWRRMKRRGFAQTAIESSGHNRWSKIKHDKAKVDSAKTAQRSYFAKELAIASKLFGPEPSLNPRLADLITKAKREGFAKTSIEAAIARGQGRSMTGSTLEGVVIEAMLPGNIACIIDCETDTRLRTLQEVRLVLKNSGGMASAIGYLFRKVGRVTFEGKEGVGVEEVLEVGLDAGATDIWENEASEPPAQISMSAEAGHIKAVGERVSKTLELEIARSEILWEPVQDTMVELPSSDVALELAAFVDELQDKEASVQAVTMNVSQGKAEDDAWKHLQSRLSR